jgi:peptidoglycan/xylan/chitin deacetylase (PgdA/CDA1 family)
MLKEIKSSIYSAALWCGRKKFKNNASKVLYYHDVHKDGTVPFTDMSTPMHLFKNHISLIKENGFEIVDEITKPTHQVMLTFDDGYLGVYQNREFFVKQGIKPTIFIITSEIGKPTFMNSDEILLLAEHGFLFQSHTHHHPDLNLCTVNELHEEYSISRVILLDLLKKPIHSICFPKGFFNMLAIEKAYDSGFSRLYSSIPGAYADVNEYNVICRNLVQFASPKDFENILLGGLNIFKNRYARQHFYT